MKMTNKIISGVLGLGMLIGFGSTAFAATGYLSASQCNVPPDHGIYDIITNQLTGCITEAAWNAAAAEEAARGGQNLPTIAPDATIQDEFGVSYTCPTELIMGHNVCVNLAGTSAYKDGMRSMARELIALGYNEQTAPRFSGWIHSVK